MCTLRGNCYGQEQKSSISLKKKNVGKKNEREEGEGDLSQSMYEAGHDGNGNSKKEELQSDREGNKKERTSPFISRKVIKTSRHREGKKQ